MSFRAKLTVWYSLCLAVLFAVFGWSAHFAMRKSSLDTVDKSLRSRLADVRDFLRMEAGRGESSVLHELQEQDPLGQGGGLLEFWDADGRLLYRSIRATAGDLGPDIKSPENIPPRPVQVATRRGSNRVAASAESFNSRRYVVRVAQPTEELDEALEGFDRLLFYLAPLLLAISALAGLLFSRRALTPVRKMGRDAHNISVGNLSQRLEVPRGKDELQELAVTLNQMLSRIDGEVQRMLQFTEDASHELRTPLTLIRSAADFSLRAKRTEEELLAALGKILRESDRTTRLVGDLLTLARAGELQLEEVDLPALIRSTAARLAEFAQSKRIELTLDLPDHEVFTTADESSLSRLLLILLDNALKYTDDSGCVSVKLTRQAGKIYVVVEDSGIGIAANDLPRIWDRFWRADKVRSRNAGGTGLGLAIARAIANQHGADLSVKSTLGKGSSFQLCILAANAASPENRNERSDFVAVPGYRA